ncbi:MAG: phage portal protein [Butyrivibrio sp.]|nr:phage portal protein [Butyrivibrio sp.]
MGLLFNRKKEDNTEIMERAENTEVVETSVENTKSPDQNSVELAETLLRAFLSTEFMTLDKAMNVPAFAGCVNLICDTISSLPVYLYKKSGDSIEKVTDDERVALINVDTKDTLTGADFKKAIIYDYLTDKGGYAFIGKSGTKFTSLNYVKPEEVSFRYSEDPIFKDYEIICGGKVYKPHNFIKIVRRTKNGFYGKTIIQENREILMTAYKSLKFEGKQVNKGGNKRGFLESERVLSQEAIDDLKKSFNLLYQDENENVIILNNGIKFKETSETSLELQLNENKKTNAVDICKLFNVPPNMVSGTATDQDKLRFIQFCIIPILEAFCKSLNRDFLLEKEKKEYFWAFDTKELTQGDIKTRYDAYATAYKTGFLQIDDIRKSENLPALDIPFIKLGLQDVLYNPETGAIFTPNMGKGYNIKEAMEESNGGDLPVGTDGNNPSDPAINQALEVTDKANGKENDDEGTDKS